MAPHDIVELGRVIAVIALVVGAAALATPKGRLPLALRGVMKILKKDAGTGRTDRTAGTSVVPTWKRSLAFVLVLMAIALSLAVV